MDIDSNQRLDYLYKEYVRLSNQSDDLIKSTYEDFKLFGALGVLIVLWKPISDLILSANSKVDSDLVLFLGFLSLLAIIGTVALLSLIRQAYVWYFVQNLQAYEMEIRKELGETENSMVFNFNIEKYKDIRYITAVYRLSFRSFLFVFALVMTFIPFVILCYSKVLYALIYLLLSLGGFVFYLQLVKSVIRQYSNSKYL